MCRQDHSDYDDVSAMFQEHWQDPRYRAKISGSRREQKLREWQDPEYRARHSGPNGRKHSDETKAKMREAQQARRIREAREGDWR